MSFRGLLHLLAIILFFSSCNSAQEKSLVAPYEISKEERAWMTQFFSDLMLFESGIYTLWGSKPCTLIIIPHYTEEELKAYHDSLSEEQKKEGVIVEGYNLAQDWEKWEKISSRFPMKRYMLFKSYLHQDPKASFVFLVDTLKTAAIIQDNYEVFRRAVGFDFHPLAVVLEMKDRESKFWAAIRDNSNSILWGLLFGFGKTNSFTFHWKNFEHPKTCEEFCERLPMHFSNEPLHGTIKFSIDNLQIPHFVAFDEHDDAIERYKIERERIKNIYRQQDFLDVTLRRLTN